MINLDELEKMQKLIKSQTSTELIHDIDLSVEQIKKNKANIEFYVKEMNNLLEDNKYYEKRIELAEKEYRQREEKIMFDGKDINRESKTTSKPEDLVKADGQEKE